MGRGRQPLERRFDCRHLVVAGVGAGVAAPQHANERRIGASRIPGLRSKSVDPHQVAEGVDIYTGAADITFRWPGASSPRLPAPTESRRDILASPALLTARQGSRGSHLCSLGA